MTRQYKSTDEELREQEAGLNQRMEQNADQIAELQKRKEEIEAEMNAKRAEKEDEIKELTLYIDQMHSNFASMLKKTLEKMKDRIKRANDAWESEQDQKLIEKFREIIDTGQ